MSKKKWLRANVVRGLSVIEGQVSVDREKNVIYGFAVMTKGNVKDSREWEIDETTLQQVAAAGNAVKNGVKSRFGHPNMSNEALGTYVGRAKNFRVEGDKVIADLHVSDTAFSAPGGDLATYVLDMAENEPDMFGTSIVMDDFTLEQRLNPDHTPMKDDEGEDLPCVLRVNTICACDVVDEPAANDGMFATQFFSKSVKLSAEMTEFLDKLMEDPDAKNTINAFLSRYMTNKSSKIDQNAHEQLTQEEKGMSQDTFIKDVTVAMLQEHRPDIVAELQKASKEAGDVALASERKRAHAIVALSSVAEFSGAEFLSIISESVEKGESFEVAEQKCKDKRLSDIEKNKQKFSGLADANCKDKLSQLPEGPEKWKADFEASPDLQADFRFGGLEGYLAFKKAEARGLITTSNKK